MITYFPNWYGSPQTPRQYLAQWFHGDLLVISECELHHPDFEQILTQYSGLKPILDFTHNPYELERSPIAIDPTLIGDYRFFYQPREGVVFFPLFLWMFSLRTNLWWSNMVFDSGNQKTQPVMCFNNTPAWHRLELYQLLEPVRHKMVYSTADVRIDCGDTGSVFSVSSWPYTECAFNIVTETSIETPFCGEKTPKPFVARQIPIMVAAPGINQFLTDLGLDMFPDIIPWSRWDQVGDHSLRLHMIADFLRDFIQDQDLVAIYHRMRSRVERNKQYFHSEQFRKILMRQIDHFSVLDT